jgi:hypothetical protein
MANESDERAAALAHLKSAMRNVHALRRSVSQDDVENAISALAAVLQHKFGYGWRETSSAVCLEPLE